MRLRLLNWHASLVVAACLLAASSGCLAQTPRSDAPSVTSQTVSFHSKALAGETTYCVFMPSAIRSGERLPVLYLLHGWSGGYRDWAERTSLADMLRGRKLIVVTPDGGFAGWYVDSPVVRNSNYETLITQDLIEDVDARFPTIPGREGRAIAGLSMGGHGALLLAVRHPGLYASASSLSGILRVTNHYGKWNTTATLGELPGAAAFWKEHCVWDQADRFTTAGLKIMFDVGTSDTTGAVTDNRQFHEELVKRSIEHRYAEHPGGHTWKYWGEHLPEHLDFHQEVFAVRHAEERTRR